jgi:hypothetical protein
MPVPGGFEGVTAAVASPDVEIAYCTREQVQAALGQADSVRNNRRIDDCILSAARDLEGELHRRFWPQTGIRYPDPRWVNGDTLWVNDIDHEIIALTSLVVDGTTLVAGVDYYLDPDRTGPPYNAVRLIRESSAAWSTLQRSIVAAGTFGGSAGSTDAGTLAAAIAGATTTSMTISDSSAIGVGDLVLVDSERVTVTEKQMVTSGATVTGTVTASAAVTTIPVSDGTLLHVGELILVGAERMAVDNIVGNNLIVRRAANASVLAAHASPDVVYVPRLCTISRAAAGTTAASHLSAAALVRNKAPSLIGETNLALAVGYLEQGKSGYARTIGAGDPSSGQSTSRAAPGAGLAGVLERAYVRYGRRGRIGVC